MYATYCFEGAQETVRNDLGASGGYQESDCLVLVSLFTKSIPVYVLEDFIESKLSEALCSISNEGWEPSLK